MISAGINGPEWSSNGENDSGGDEQAVPSTDVRDSSEALGFDTDARAYEKANASLLGKDNSAVPGVSDNMNESGGLKFGNEGYSLGDAGGGGMENQRSHSVSRGHVHGDGNSDVQSGNYKSKKATSAMPDYNSILAEFDHFASKGSGEAVGFGYEIGDMVWGKVKSHPWWPGHIFSEAFASHSVQRSKREGHVLVAFYGDSSYGWFDPAELVPFEENFTDKSRQTSSRSFVKAVEEAVDELSRRRALGLACCCRNEFNFGPSTKEGYFVVDVGDYEPGVFSLRQINKARDDFCPKKMLSYVKQMSLAPMTDQHSTIESIKNKATIMACRKALFEEFDETYAEAFGSVPVRPSRPTSPIAVDPSKAPLSGRLVFAETLDKGKHPVKVKQAKMKDQLEKDKYLFVRRDAPVQVNTKRTTMSVQSGDEARPIAESHMHQASVESKILSEIGEDREVSAENVKEKKTKKKKRKTEAAARTEHNVNEKQTRRKEIPNEGSGADGGAVENFSSEPILDGRKKDDALSFVSPVVAPKSGFDLPFLVRDLRTLALDPISEGESDRPSTTTTLSVFSKYRSLVFQKSLVSTETVEAHSTTTQPLLGDKTDDRLAVMKPTRPPPRPIDDPTKGGRKRDLPERPLTVKKKKLPVEVQGGTNTTKRMKISGSEDVERKKIKRTSTEDSKFAPRQKPIAPTGVVKVEPKKRAAVAESSPTMLVMRFPSGAALPSGPQLRAKFARFGPLDLDGTRVFWKTYTCRLVYRRREDAEDALHFAQGSENLFGSTNVRCFIKEVEVEPSTEPETAAKVKSDGQGLHAVQLKSILKKPPNDEPTTGGGNGSGRGGSRVKFALAGEAGAAAAGAVTIPSAKPQEPVSNLPVGSAVTPLATHSVARHPQFKKSSRNVTSSAEPPPPNNTPLDPPPALSRDISQQLLDLMATCSDVVNRLSGRLGYMPYHAL